MPCAFSNLCHEGLHLPHQDDPSFRTFHIKTILDGELVLDTFRDGTSVMRYLVFDCIVLDGEILGQKTFDKRIGRFQQFVQKPLSKLIEAYPHERQYFPFEVIMKTMEKPYALDTMFTQLPNLPHGNDGLIFTAKSALYTSGTDEMILKWKPADENSIDFKLMLGEFPRLDPGDGGSMIDDFEAKPNLYLLVYCGKHDYKQFAELYVTDQEWQNMKSLNQLLDGRIIECYYDREGRWRYKKETDGNPRFREDKPEANHISTVQKVLQSIEDGVSQSELCASQPDIYKAWKNRHPEEDRHRPRPGASH